MRVMMISVLLLLVAIPVAAQGYDPVYEPGDCPFPTDGLDIACGTLIVPEDRDNPGGAEVELAEGLVHSCPN